MGKNVLLRVLKTLPVVLQLATSLMIPWKETQPVHSLAMVLSPTSDLKTSGVLVFITFLQK